MTLGKEAGVPTRSKSQSIALGVIAVLLVAVLVVLVVIAWRGVRVEHTGWVTVDGLSDGIELRMADPVTLEVPEAVRMVAGGAASDAIPVDVSFPACSECGGTMLPVRWNLWSGEIEWVCPACGETASGPPGG